MSQGRWDVVIRYLSGPLSLQEDQVYRGPVVRLGANPGPGGVQLSGYRGLDARHAVITSYDGGTVTVAPVGTSQVRIAPHGNVNWAEIQALHEPAHLSDGAVVHLGPPGRGITFCFVESRQLGVWEEQRILSDASQATPGVQPTSIKELSASRGVPSWFIGGIVMIGMLTVVGVLASLLSHYQKPISGLGPVMEGKEYHDFVSMDIEVNTELREGLDQPMADFVMIPNAQAAGWKEVGEDPRLWDQRFVDQVTRSFQLHSQGWKFFERLEAIAPDWGFVVGEVRRAELPEVFAAIPYQESRYRQQVTSPVCALGYWQFMPEVALRMGLEVRNCWFRGAEVPWNPERLIPVRNVLRRGEYVEWNPEEEKGRCRISRCEVDDRTNRERSTRAAIKSLAEAWEDPDLRASGALAQLVITSHNAGYDDSRFEERRQKSSNVLPAYLRYLERRGLRAGPHFMGDSIHCLTANFDNKGCGGDLMGETQHYAYNIVAQHFLAVCYYGMNHDDQPAFQPWRKYVRGDGYCTRANIPTAEQVRKRMGR